MPGPDPSAPVGAETKVHRGVYAAHALAVLLCAAAAVAHQTTRLWTWYIEDSAISFAYSRHLAEGLGLVPWSGSERVEGYSNPTWVALLGLLEWLGADAMAASKWVAAVLAALTVPMVYLLARECVPARWREVPLLACGFLAADPQFAIWGSSGLENSLFSFLLAAALTRSLVESRTGGRPWSAILWFLLAVTRPEAPLYVGVGLLVAVFAERRSVARMGAWLALFLVPFAAYHAARYSYFAWPFPMTYYAKLETKDPNVLRWMPNLGWKYIRDWGVQTGRGLLVFAWIPAVVGRDRWRLIAAVLALALLGTAFLYPDESRWLWPAALAVPAVVGWRAAEWVGRTRAIQAAIAVGFCVAVGVAAALNWTAPAGPFHRPAWWNIAPPYLILAVMGLVPFLGLGNEGWRGRVACWLSGGLSLGFAVQTLGDWMKAFRWLSLLSVPGAVLAAVGCAVIGEGIVRWFRPWVRGFWGEATVRGLGGAVGLTALGFCAAGGWTYSADFAKHPETTPKSVRARVTYMTAAVERMKLEGRVRDLDVDMGAHLWWGRWRMTDIAGLIDIPFAINRFDRNFVPQYVFDEVRPHLAHLHGNWASSSRITSFPQWKGGYVEIPGYGAAGAQLHIGNHVRRDLLLVAESPFPEGQAVPLTGNLTFEGFEVPSRQVAAGGAFRVHVGASVQKKRADNELFRVTVFIADAAGHLASWDAAPAYDWVRPSDWRVGEVGVGKYDFRLPASLPEGVYDLGLVFTTGAGVMAPLDGLAEPAPRFAVGEIRFTGVLTVVSGADALRAADADWAEGLAAAEAQNCTIAERKWFEARMHVVQEKTWIREKRRPAMTALARCWVAVSRATRAPDEAVAALLRARDYDWLDTEVVAHGVVLAEQRHAAGEVARAAEDWKAAFHGFNDAVAVDPTRAWSRRAAEEMRQKWLNIDLPAAKAKRLERAKNKRPPPAPRVPAKAPVPRVPAKSP